jgi:hypothetical protein
LAWFSIRRYQMFFGSDNLYKQALKSLPLNSELRPMF